MGDPVALSFSQLLLLTLPAAVVSSVVSPLIFYWLKRRDERSQRRLDRRTEDYCRYFTTLQELQTDIRHDFEELLSVKLPQHFSRIIRGEPDSEAFNADMGELYSKVMSLSTRAKLELQALKLTCSDKVLALLNHYVALYEELPRAASKIAIKCDNLDEVNRDFAALAARSDDVHQALVRQMRKEIADT